MSATVRLRVPETLTSALAVYVERAPDPKDIQRLAVAFVQSRAGDPLKGALARFVGSELVRIDVRPRALVPEPPAELLLASGGHEADPAREEAQRFAAAKEVVVVSAKFVLVRPLLHVWAALAAARAVALATSGVVLDPEIPRLLPIAGYASGVPGDGRVVVADHVVVPTNAAETKGAAATWTTTSGMPRFGLPDLEMRFVPPGRARDVVPLVLGVAQRLLDQALDQAARAPRETALEELELEAEQTVTLTDVAAAFGDPRPTADASEGATVALTHEPGQAFVTVGPPASFTGERAEWYPRVLRALVGAPADATEN